MDSMAQLHTELKTLIDMIEAGDKETADGASMVEVLGRVDALGQAVQTAAPPMLLHYLERRSYTKALDFLEGRDETAAPNC